MENCYLVNGGRRLKGVLNLSGAKNVALKVIIASLLFEEKVVLKNIPRINDVIDLINLINSLGSRAVFVEKNTLEIDPRGLNKNVVSLFHGSKIRVSFMLLAPLLYKFSKCFIPNPGGCRIGARPIDRIVDGLVSLGVKVSYDSKTGFYQAQMSKKPAGYYRFLKPTHTGTELMIMISILSGSEVILDNCATEPEIDDLIKFLNESGAKIERDGRRIRIIGVSRLKFHRPYSIITDRNEAVTFICLTLGTGGEIFIDNLQPEVIESFIDQLKKTGATYEIRKNGIYFRRDGNLGATQVETSIHPGFMTDWQPNWAVLMTQASGRSEIIERVFENRFTYVSELKKLGAKINFLVHQVPNPSDYYFFNYDHNKIYHQKIEIIGPTPLHNGVLTITDLRAGASLAVAALIGQGESIIHQVSILERGYENFVEKTRDLGAEIRKI
ncbi:MAG: UDP-N-acetylglucosamine 1-carboxyvinyltransferase [Patescibacteria group bacterium]|nr:UDP-N-acetylglucosamine 1-carboxyvinyltransferase [Patescibacteria group bacterium]